ncbi:hypothetical protein VPH35_116871 [Triticum aestivum]|uniref:uncharacterized protein n=1 Tax=Triticum aestivum TaxID=4565 RepID=UPI001D019CC0|nr:uncharacterized protein LOC123144511 [Triticum aestivum]
MQFGTAKHRTLASSPPLLYGVVGGLDRATMAAAPIWDASTVPYRGSGRRNVLRRSNSDRVDGALQSTLHNELDVQFISGVRLVCARRAVRLVSSSSPASVEVQLWHCGMWFCAHLHAVPGHAERQTRQQLGLQQTPTSRLYCSRQHTLHPQVLLERFTVCCQFPIWWFSFQARMVVRLSCSSPVHSVRFTGRMTAVHLTLVRCRRRCPPGTVLQSAPGPRRTT